MNIKKFLSDNGKLFWSILLFTLNIKNVLTIHDTNQMIKAVYAKKLAKIAEAAKLAKK